MKRALDAAVVKQGVFTLVFHPHKWIKAEQIVELIDHAVAKHGTKVKFLNFREAAERLNKNLLAGQPLRDQGRRRQRRAAARPQRRRIPGRRDRQRPGRRTHASLVARARASGRQRLSRARSTQASDARFGIAARRRQAAPCSTGRGKAWHFDGTAWVRRRPTSPG